jgi:hypothetical protein
VAAATDLHPRKAPCGGNEGYVIATGRSAVKAEI